MTATINISQRALNLPTSTTLAVTARVRQLKAQGQDIVGFGVGEPDFDTPAFIKQAAIDALLAGKTKYAPVPGDPDARQAIADKLRGENGIACTADDIVISAGAKHSLYLALQCLLDVGAGQDVIIPTPAWVSYRPMVELAGGHVVEVPGDVRNDFKITPDQLREAITERTAVIMLNSPSNPCGTMYTPEELNALGDVIAEHEPIVVVTDEIYEKLIFGDCAHFSIGSRDDLAGRTITVNGLSKAYAMTGWRIGYACGPNGIAKQMSKMQSQMTSNITTFCYPAVVAALTKGADDVERMRKTFAERAVLIKRLVDDWDDVICPTPTGAFYVFPDVSAYFGRTTAGGRTIDSAMAFAEAMLEEARVAVVPGEDFGACAATHIRLSFATSEAQIREGCGRIAAWLASVK
ncbi:MAG: pyridoxal phosphate-dependent aminotransferase [Phycisphaerales bacterium]|nr:pyridoxal phosphate-dependent aminotransferase [Phycisphaerales bacterium]